MFLKQNYVNQIIEDTCSSLSVPARVYCHHDGARHLVIQHCRQHFDAVLLVRRTG
jgi:hypothetical protein